MRISTKSKLRKANTGAKNPFYGKKHTVRTKDLLRSVNNRRVEFYARQVRHFGFSFEDFWTEEERQKKAIAMIAELNPNWKGGSAKIYDQYQFELMRREVLKRDNYTCQVCGKTTDEKGTNLHCHHISGDTFDCSVENGITLCKLCHIGSPDGTHMGVHKRTGGVELLQKFLKEKGLSDDLDK